MHAWRPEPLMRPGGGPGCASSRLRFSLGTRGASISSISGSGKGFGRQDSEGCWHNFITWHSTCAHTRARPRAPVPARARAGAENAPVPTRARGRARARARVRACRVPCYGVMPASFEILPPETLSGDADAADARPPGPQRETKPR